MTSNIKMIPRISGIQYEQVVKNEFGDKFRMIDENIGRRSSSWISQSGDVIRVYLQNMNSENYTCEYTKYADHKKDDNGNSIFDFYHYDLIKRVSRDTYYYSKMFNDPEQRRIDFAIIDTYTDNPIDRHELCYGGVEIIHKDGNPDNIDVNNLSWKPLGLKSLRNFSNPTVI